MQKRLSLSQQQKQQQHLSPLQVQFVRMLEMNRLEIEDEVKRELDENPALEVVEHGEGEYAQPSADDTENFNESAEELQMADYRNEEEIPYYRYNANNHSTDEQQTESVVIAEGSLIDYLTEQLTERELTDTEWQISEYIIGSIDDNGYLQRNLRAITDDIIFQTGLDVSEENVAEVLSVIQDLEPAGVGATDLRECLLLQLERLQGNKITLLAHRVVSEYFDEFSKKHYAKIISLLDIDEDTLKDIIAEIVALNPKPGSSISMGSSSEHQQQIIPDFLVEIDGDTLNLTLLNNLPELQIEESFSSVYESIQRTPNKRNSDEEGNSFIRQKYETAAGFIKILRQRQETLFTTMRTILMLQREFFTTGDETKLKPMVLKDVADITGADISVISRATSSKYVITQWGVFSLKFFFNEGLQHESGEEVSSREIQTILRNIIDQEDKRKPYADEVLCAMLREKGYEIARRTVAKYREKLSIPIARLRKEL
ncbi:MAG: RNA polymerase factor sigma-54 [Bacteroidales bacterium]